MTVSSWYFGSRESFYFDTLYTGTRRSFQRFKIIIKPDLSDSTLHVMNMSEIFLEDLLESLKAYRACADYRICDDALVYYWETRNHRDRWGAYTGLTSAPYTNIVTRSNEEVQVQSLCPSSGRFVYYTDDRRLVVVDLF